MIPTRLTAGWSAGLLVLLVACGPAPTPSPWEPVLPLEEPPPLVQAEPPAGAVHLLAGLSEATLQGDAARMVQAPPPVRQISLLTASFDGEDSPFSPYFGLAGGQEGGSFDLIDGALRLAGPAPHGISGRSAQVPVQAGRVYVLRYRIKASGTPDKKRGVVAAASLVGYGKGRRMGMIPGFSAPSARHGDWTDVQVRFRVPDWAEAVEVSLDLGRPVSDRGEYDARGLVWFDDVELVELDAPVFDFFAGGVDRADHPLTGRVTLRGASGGESSEARDVVWAPAPSTLSFDVSLPGRPLLRVGSGLLPDVGGGRGSVRFTVEVEEQDGERAVAASWSVPARTRRWMDHEIDLARWRGRDVRLHLVTTARGRTPNSPGDVSARAAVWSDPLLVDADGRGRRVVLVGIDTLSAIRTGPWGHAAGTTPNLDRIAALGTRYERAWSPSPWTLPAFASLLTGLGPGQHGAGGSTPGSRAGRGPLAPQAVTLAERLVAAGWSTRAWVNNPFLSAAFGTDQGFDRHDDYGTRARPGASEGAVAAAIEWLTAPGPDDRFAFMHLMEPHGPYLPTAASAERFAPAPRAGPLADGMSHSELVDLARGRLALDHVDRQQVARLHDAVIADADGAVGRLFDAVAGASDDGRLLFVVVADHGEELWDHDGFEHGHTAWDELVRVPLLVFGDGAPARVVTEPVSVAAVAPTILAFAGLDPDGGWSEAALPDSSLPVVGGRSLYGPDRWYAWARGHKLVVEVDDAEPGARSVWLPGGAALFDLEADPGEERDLLARGSLEPAAAGAVRAAWRQLAPELVASMGDCWVVAIAPGVGASVPLKGRLSVPEDALPARRRFVAWPDARGRPGLVELRPGRSGRSLRFTLPGQGGVLAVPARDGARGGLRVVLDDPPEGTSEQNQLSREQVVDLARFFALPAEPAPRVLIGYLPGEATSARLAPSALDQLRSLGYVE